MACKINLEKAYDKMNWVFICQILLDIGLRSTLILLIMSCVVSSSFQVLWNGETIDSFVPSRRLRQGDPLSPYLFVLGTEHLTRILQDKIAKGLVSCSFE